MPRVRHRCPCGAEALIRTTKTIAAQPIPNGPCLGQHNQPVRVPTGDIDRAMRLPAGGPLAKAMS